MMATPDVQDGIKYWSTQPASLDGVLGGYGSGSLPRIDALGSRQFLLHLLPELSTVPSSLIPLPSPPHHRIRALDVGAGIGRVTSTVLLHLVQDVVLLEPVDKFVREAYAAGSASAEGGDVKVRWKGIKERTKSVTFLQGTLQSFDPSHPLSSTQVIGRVGYSPSSPSPLPDLTAPLDIAWCQWCLGHLSDPDLVSFLKRCKSALREGGRSLVVVKENLCRDSDGEAGGEMSPRTVFDEQDSSLTRSDLAWKKIFVNAGLKLVKERIQEGLPDGLYEVKMYALR